MFGKRFITLCHHDCVVFFFFFSKQKHIHLNLAFPLAHGPRFENLFDRLSSSSTSLCVILSMSESTRTWKENINNACFSDQVGSSFRDLYILPGDSGARTSLGLS